jgi:hypothetical protein
MHAESRSMVQYQVTIEGHFEITITLIMNAMKMTFL